jgi:hypothetical protein
MENAASWQRVLAFAHPAWMIASLVVAVMTARLGLDIRRRRIHGQPVGGALRKRHLRFGQRAITMVVLGFATGPVSMMFLRERDWFDSFHSILGIIVLGLFLWTGWTGRALARGDREARRIHRVAAAGALGVAMLSAIAGFTLLP